MGKVFKEMKRLPSGEVIGGLMFRSDRDNGSLDVVGICRSRRGSEDLAACRRIYRSLLLLSSLSSLLYCGGKMP